MFSYLFIFKKNSCQHFDGGGDLDLFFDSLNFEKGRSAWGGSPLFLFLILSLFSHSLSHSHSHFKSFSHLSFISILPLSNKFNLLFGSKVLTVRRGPTLGTVSLPPQPESCLTSFAHFISAPLRCATWLGLFFCPCFRSHDRVLKTMI